MKKWCRCELVQPVAGDETACKMGVCRCFVNSPRTQLLLTRESEKLIQTGVAGTFAGTIRRRNSARIGALRSGFAFGIALARIIPQHGLASASLSWFLSASLCAFADHFS